MINSNEVERLKVSLAHARRKHADAKDLVNGLKGRVGPTSFKLSDAKGDQRRCKEEVDHFKTLLKELGLTDSEIARIKASEPVVA